MSFTAEQLTRQGLLALAQGQNLEALACLEQADWIRHGKPWNLCSATEQKNFFEPQSWQTPPDSLPLHKLEHDREQIEYLLQEHKLPAAFAFIQTSLEQVISSIHQRFSQIDPREMLLLTPFEQGLLQPFWNRNLYREPLPEYSGDIFNPELDRDRVMWSFHHNQPGLAFCDQVLSPPVLASLRTFILSSTIWHDYHRGAYVGSYLPDGFYAPLLLQIADAFHREFPEILKTSPLSLMWSYKHSQQQGGVGIHADSGGKVNVNLWLTPDEANLTPQTGGLLIYDVIAPPDWSPHKYKLEAITQSKPCKVYPIPYRFNRALFFNSGLFHASAPIQFKPGYTNRRINLTLLFGIHERLYQK